MSSRADRTSRQPSNWNVANALTTLRLVLVPLFGWLLLAQDGDSAHLRVAALAVFLAAAATDRFDGDIARRRGLVTDFGKLVDPIADKALMGMAFVGLSLLGELPWWVTVVVMVREVGVTALRFVVLRHGVIAASHGGKVKTALQTLALGLYIAPLPDSLTPVAVVTMVLAVVVTLVTGIDYVFRALALRSSDQRADAV
ncbi:MAG: CDP-diacylglycerol--glycerol-3-phosphate 3-phosphatidyltransferase [Nocardioidaceae bacterium]